MIQNELNGMIMNAMKAGEKLKLQALKSIKTAFVQWTTAKENVGKEWTDAIEVKILRSLKAQYEDAAVQCNDGKHDELVAENSGLAACIGEFLPADVSEADIDQKVTALINGGLEPVKSNMGKFIKAVMADYPAADGKVISKVVLSHIQ